MKKVDYVHQASDDIKLNIYVHYGLGYSQKIGIFKTTEIKK